MPFIDLPDRIPGLRARARSDKPWYQFRNLAADEAELFLYDEIGGWGTLAEDFIAELKTITAPKLRVRVSSPGGSVFEGIALANALRTHPAEVTVQVDGIAASIASVIAMAGDRVVVQPQAMIMCHDAAGVCLGNAQDMADMAALLDKISGNIADAYAEKTGGTREEWRELMRAESWFTAEEAVAAGLADECMPPRKQQPAEGEPEMRQSFDLAAYGYKGPRQPEAPKPAPPASTPAPAASQPTLTIPIAAALGEQIAEALRAAVTAEPAVGPAEPAPVEPTAADTTGDAEPERPAAEPEPQQPQQPQPVAVQLDADTLAAAIRKATQPEPAPAAPEPAAAPSLAARTAHLKPARPAAPTWRDRVAHLNPPSSATTQPAP